MRLLRAALVMLPLFAACGDDLPDAQVNGVFPTSGFLGRNVRVQVSGDSSEWSESATVSFGPGVTVNDVTLASPSALYADITIEPGAEEGLNDVTVTDGETLTLAGAFELRSPISVSQVSLSQGSLGSFEIRNLDLEHPFDTTTDQDGNFLVTLTGGAGVTLFANDVTDFAISASALVDVDAATGPLTVVSDNLTSPGGDLAVQTRAASALTAGTGADTVVVPEGSLFEFTAASAGFLTVGIGSGDPNAGTPGFIVLPASGKFADALGRHLVDNRFVAAGDKFYLIVVDIPSFFGSVFGYDATITPKLITPPATAVVDANNNETAATGQTVTGPVAQFNGTLANETDVDCVRISTGAANKKIHVYTTDEDVGSDTVVEIFDVNNTDPLDLTGTDDADFGEDMVTGVIAGNTTHGVCFSNSSFGNAPNAPYKAIIVIE